MNYKKAEQLLGGRVRKKLTNNTWLRAQGGDIAVIFFETAIVTYYRNGGVGVDHGGHLTQTTMRRLGEFGPDGWSFFSDRGVWMAQHRDEEAGVFEPGLLRPGKGGTKKAKAAAAARRKLRKRALEFVDDYMAAFAVGDVPAPNAGDCFFCALVSENGKTMGEMGSNDHLLSHMSDGERYFVPSMLSMAHKRFAHGDWSMAALARHWSGQEDVPKYIYDWSLSELKEALRAFVLQQLGFPARRSENGAWRETYYQQRAS